MAPEHCSSQVLDYMGKPHFDVYEKFLDKYHRLNQRYGLEQYVVPYLMSSHPGCTINDAVDLAVFLNRTGRQPEQVQDFYPTPGTLSTCMWYTELDPRTMEPVYVAKTPHDKALQRALLQWKRPEMRRLVTEALHRAGRTDLIGYGKDCLIRPLHGAPEKREGTDTRTAPKSGKAPAKQEKRDARAQRREGPRQAGSAAKAGAKQEKAARKPNSPTHSKQQQRSKSAKDRRR